jgi:hypothetical protein
VAAKVRRERAAEPERTQLGYLATSSFRTAFHDGNGGLRENGPGISKLFQRSMFKIYL